MLRLLRWGALAVSGLALTACATMNVGSHVEQGLDFTQYHTYEWGPADSLPTGDPRLDQNPFFRDHFQGAVEKQLASRHIEQVSSGRPDLLIHYHANISDRIDVNRVDRDHGYCYDDDCRTRVLDYEAGTLVLDVIDARTNRLIWRGWAQSSIEGVLNNPERMDRQISEAVKRMFARFPRSI